MNKLQLIAAAAAFAIAGAVPATAKVNVIHSASPSLARGSSFAWAAVPARGFGMPDPKLANEVTADRLRVLTEVTLANKGYRMVSDASQADLLVSYTIVIVPETDTQLSGGTIAYSLDTARYTQGTLVLDLLERESGRLVWRATSEKRVTGKDVTQEKLGKLLNEMTKSLPTH